MGGHGRGHEGHAPHAEGSRSGSRSLSRWGHEGHENTRLPLPPFRGGRRGGREGSRRKVNTTTPGGRAGSCHTPPVPFEEIDR